MLNFPRVFIPKAPDLPPQTEAQAAYTAAGGDLGLAFALRLGIPVAHRVEDPDALVPVPTRRDRRAARTRRRKLASYSRRVHRKLGEVSA